MDIHGTRMNLSSEHMLSWGPGLYPGEGVAGAAQAADARGRPSPTPIVLRNSSVQLQGLPFRCGVFAHTDTPKRDMAQFVVQRYLNRVIIHMESFQAAR